MIIGYLVRSVKNSISDSVHQSFVNLSQIAYGDGKWKWLKYWPTVLSGSIATAAIAASIASLILGSLTNTILYAVIGLGTFILAGTVHVFIPLKSLEKQTTEYQEQNIKLQSNLATSHQLGEKLHTSDCSLQKVNEDLKASLDASKRIQEAEIKKITEATSLLSQQLEKKNEEMDSLRELLHTFIDASDGLAPSIQQLNEVKATIEEKEQSVQKVTNTLVEQTLQVKEQTAKLAQQRKIQLADTAKVLKLADRMTSLASSMKDMCSKSMEVQHSLRQEVNELRRMVNKESALTTNLTQTTDAFQDILEKAKQASPFLST